MPDVIYENENNKLKVTMQVTQSEVLDKEQLVSHRTMFFEQLTQLENSYALQRVEIVTRIEDIDAKIAKCNELGIKTSQELLEESLNS